MKKCLESLLERAVDRLKQQDTLPKTLETPILIERGRDPSHGDFSSNLALVLSKKAGVAPRRLAEQILEQLESDPRIIKTDIAGPGFINFFLAPTAHSEVIVRIHEQRNGFGHSQMGQGQGVLIEFVSANPTGPLHVGHGRGAAFGAVVARLLEATGHEVLREYYVNDAGRQMDILAVSVWLRYLEHLGGVLRFPANGYRGAYVSDIARRLENRVGRDLFRDPESVFQGLPADEADGGDKEIHIDGLIERAKTELGPLLYRRLFEAGLHEITDEIRQDLEEFGVHFDRWYSERSLEDSGALRRVLERLKAQGLVYEQQGALWFASSRLGDEKDRVVVRENGQSTYFASDIAYHLEKVERGFDRIIDVWGADHHGYIPRVRAALSALGASPERLEVLLVQFAVLYRGEEKVQMSTRSGEFVTLRQLRNEVGRDAARFFYVMRKSDQHMDFDLKLATSRTNENPVYYVQYAHARICSVFRQLTEKGLKRDEAQGLLALDRLGEPSEISLLSTLQRFPEVVEQSALQRAPHHIVHYLRELAAELHGYYNVVPFLVEEEALRNARLALIEAVRQVLCNGLDLLGVSAPETM